MFSGIVLHGSSKERLQAWAHCEDRSEIFDTASCFEQYWRSPHLWEEYATDPMYRRSLAQTWWGPKLCQNMPTTWWNLDKNAQNVSTPMSFTVQSMDFFYQLTKLIAIEPLIPVLEECHTCDDVWEPTWRQLGRFGSRICYVPFGYSSNYQKHSQDWPAALLNGFKDNGPFLDLEFVWDASCMKLQQATSWV